MKPVIRLLKNSAALSSAVLFERATTFLLGWYVARVEGREFWGEYATALTFLMIAGPFAFWGLHQLLPREVAATPEDAGLLMVSGLTIGAITGAIMSVLLVVIVGFLGYAPQVVDLIRFGVLTTLLPYTVYTLLEAVINGLERMEWVAFVRLPTTLLRVAVSIYLLAQGHGLRMLLVVLAVDYAVASAGYIFLLWRMGPRFRFSLCGSCIKQLFLGALPFVAILAIGESSKQASRVLLSALWSTDALGLYAVGTVILQLLYLVAPALMSAIFPLLVRVYNTPQGRFSSFVAISLQVLLAAFYPVALFVAASSGSVIRWMYGPEYSDAALVMRITAGAIVPSFLSRFLYRVILASGNERVSVRIALVNSIAALTLSAWLVSRHGLIGASVVAGLVELSGLIQNTAFVTTKVVDLDLGKVLLKPTICLLISLACYASLQSGSPFVAWLVACGVFVGLLRFFGVITLAELRKWFATDMQFKAH